MKPPVIFQLESTSICNLRCNMCPYRLMTRKKRHMEWEEFVHIAQYLQKGQSVGLHVMGEPLLHPWVVNMVEYLTRNGIRAELATNCSVMSERLAEALIDAGLGEIWFSFDSADPILYEQIRGQRFVDAVYNVLTFLRINKGHGSPVQAVVQKIGPLTNDKDAEKFKYMWRDWDARVKFLDTWAGTFSFSCTHRGGERYPCAEPWNRVAVLVNGDVVPCCRDWEPKHVYGNLFENTLDEIWAGKKVLALREDMKSGTYSIEPCASCEEWMIPMNRDVVSCE